MRSAATRKVFPASAAFATNPGTMGQPGQSCEDLGITHQGFTTGGFANATSRYANVPESGQGQETNRTTGPRIAMA